MINKSFSSTLIILEKKNLNDRIYTNNESLKAAIKDFNERPIVYGQINWPEDGRGDVTLSKASHTINNVRIVNNKVIGDITILNTVHGRILNKNLHNYVFRSSSIGSVDPINNIVNIDRIKSFDAIELDDDPFEDIAEIRKRKMLKIKNKC